MLLKNLKERLCLEKKEIIINKKAIIRGQEVIILSFVKGENTNKLWIAHKNNKSYEEIEDESKLTNRDLLLRDIEVSQNTNEIYINEMVIQNEKVTFQSSESQSIEHLYGIEQLIALKYFIENNLIPKEWDETDIKDIVLSIYEQNSEEKFPIINENEEINITLKIDEIYKEVLIQHPISMTLGEIKDNKIYYIEKNTNEEDYFYLDGLERYDLWTETMKNLDESFEYLEEHQREKFKSDYINSIEDTCPKDKDLAVVMYETEDNTQLRFLTKDYLDSYPEYTTYPTTAMYLSIDDKIGDNGYTKQSDVLKPIEKDFSGEIEIELFSKYVKIPEEIVTI